MGRPKPLKPSIVDRLKAKQQPPALPPVQFSDLRNLCFAARRALATLEGADLLNVTSSILLAEANIAAKAREEAAAQPQPAPAADPAATAPKAAEAAAKV
jgi:hypothetical protein